MEGSGFIFVSVQLMYYKCHKLNFRSSGSYIDSPDWIKKKKATTNLKNKDDKCFQYAVMVALNYEEIKWNPETTSNIESFINRYKWKGMNYSSKIDDWETFDKNNLTVTLHLFILKKKKYVELVF